MKIREFKTEDLEQLVGLAQQHNLLLPPDGMVNVAEDNEGNAVGMMLVRMVPMIEPFICTNPLIGKKLFDTTIQQLARTDGYRGVIRCNANKKDVELYKKLGFYEVFNNCVIMEKGI